VTVEIKESETTRANRVAVPGFPTLTNSNTAALPTDDNLDPDKFKPMAS